MASTTTTTALVLPAVLHGGRRRITHVSAELLDALIPYVRAGSDSERSAVLASLVALAADADVQVQGDAEEASIDCQLVPALGAPVRLHRLIDGGFLATFSPEQEAAG